MWHCALVSCISSQNMGLFFGIALFWSCVIMCSFYYFIDRVLCHHGFHHHSCNCHWDFWAILFILSYTFRLSVTKLFWFCKCATPWMFPPLDIRHEYWIDHATFSLLYFMLTFPTRIFFRGVPGFGSDCPWGVWCGELISCFLYVGPLFGNLVWNDSRFVSLT